MVEEWHSEYNSFNSWKGLMYIEHYRAILKGEFLPPIEVNLDPVNQCNLACVWCNNAITRTRNIIMPIDKILKLIEYLKKWGAKAICVAGGGEPTLHPNLDQIFDFCKFMDMPISILTNGTFKYDWHIPSVAEVSRWIGVSLDCATKKTYLKLKKSDKFDVVINNMKLIAQYGTKELTYKFLLHPDNQYEVYKAIELAKDIGCQRIHIRPLAFMYFQDCEADYDIGSINDQVIEGRGIFEDDNFKVFYVQHKYNKDLHRTFNFKKCLATPIMMMIEANGDVMLCIDRKNEPSMCIGNVYKNELKEIWGSDQHKRVIEGVNLKDCQKCTFNKYNEQIEKAVINNALDYEFT